MLVVDVMKAPIYFLRIVVRGGPLSSCCDEPKSAENVESCHPKKRLDYLFWSTGAVVAISVFLKWFFWPSIEGVPYLSSFVQTGSELMHHMWWGLVASIAFVGVLSQVPREFVMAILGDGNGLKGILRATLAGMLLDLCSHGILIVGMKLYERGASLGQLMAFLIASPWNSLSLTIILVALIGLKWTLVFIVLSGVVAIITGLIFESLSKKGVLAKNPNRFDLPEGFRFYPEAKRGLSRVKFDLAFFKNLVVHGIADSRIVLRWVFLGVVIASAMRAFLTTDDMQTYFGPSLMGLALTLVAATIIEVCSEGTAPIAAEILRTAGAPGNAFVFLMTGVATDYTEIMVIKDATKSWKIALFLPLVTVPQVIVLGYIINNM